jgi:hypothetical protein
MVGSRPTQRATRMRLITRGGYDWTDRYPWIVEAARKVRQKRFVLDGEAVILGVDGISDFDAFHSGKHDEESESNSCANHRPVGDGSCSNLEVLYFNGGIQQSFNERNAIELVKKECGGAFRITSRSDSGSNSYVGAVCVH